LRYLLPQQNTLLVRGPNRIRVLEGSASILAAEIQLNHPILVSAQKQLPIEANSDVILELSVRPTATFEVKGSTIPPSWKSAADALVDMREGKVMVIGDTDVGKSTLTVFLINRLLRNHVEICVVDADIGQAELGPPTTIGSARPLRPITSLNDLDVRSLLFIGNINPSRVESKLIESIRRLSSNNPHSLTIINTDGWIQEPEAILFKTQMIESTNPDLVLGLAKENELQPILAASRSESMKVDAARQVLARSRRNRREIRAEGYRRALEGGRTRAISLKGFPISFPLGFSSPRGLRAEELCNLIVGLVGANGYLDQIGIFMGVDGDKARIYCRDVASFQRVEFGHVRLTPSGHEIGFFSQ